jgi:hypothetical protein
MLTVVLATALVVAVLIVLMVVRRARTPPEIRLSWEELRHMSTGDFLGHLVASHNARHMYRDVR